MVGEKYVHPDYFGNPNMGDNAYYAGDGSGRLFIVEQAGRILVAQPASATSTVFLDIQSRVLNGGEQGLLGLAFHPDYSTNGRFFVN